MLEQLDSKSYNSRVRILRQLFLPLSLSCDLANGNPPETAIRTACIAVRIGERHGLRKSEIAELGFTSILRFMGCTSFSTEEAKTLGNEILIRRTLAHLDSEDPFEILKTVLLKNTQAFSWAGIKNAVLNGETIYRNMASAHCETASYFANDLGLSQEVKKSLNEFYERWDGKGEPNRKQGEDISINARIINLAYFIELMEERLRPSEIQKLIQKRKGKQFDPNLTKYFDSEILTGLHEESVWEELETTLSHIPKSRITQTSELHIAEVFGKMVDLKSIYTPNHSKRVCELAIKMSESLSLNSEDKTAIQVAAYLKDLGMLSIPNQIIESGKPLKKSDRDVIEMHTYATMRILGSTELPRLVREIAGSHHENLDGSGYHRNLTEENISKPSQILSLADKIVAMQSNRSYRKPLTDPEIKKVLYHEAKGGKLNRDVVDVGLESLGFYIKKSKPKNINGLTDREISVLQKISQGLTNSEIAKELGISPRTIQHHSIHIYNKIGVNSRAGATLFASKNRLV